MIYHCAHKKVLRFRKKAADFLKAYTSNEASRPRNAFIDVHGKIIATVDQFLVSPDEALIIIEKPFEERLRAHLAAYLPLYGTEISDARYNVYFDLEAAYVAASDEIAIPQKAGQLILSPYLLPASVSEDDFRRFRVKNRIPVQGEDYDQDILLNVADEEFVSYEKGCYLGQEIIARIHFRGKPAKKLIVKTENECTIEERSRMTSKTRGGQESQVSGFLMVAN